MAARAMAVPAAQRKPAGSSTGKKYECTDPITGYFYGPVPYSYWGLRSRLSLAAKEAVGEVLRRTRWDEIADARLPEWAGFDREKLAKEWGISAVAVYLAFKEAVKLGALRERKHGLHVEYSANWEHFTRIPERARRTAPRGEKPTEKPEPLSVPVALTCPKGETCPVNSVVEGEDGVFKNLILSNLPIHNNKNASSESKGLTAGVHKIAYGLDAKNDAPPPPHGAENGRAESKGVTGRVHKLSYGLGSWDAIKTRLRSSVCSEGYENWVQKTEELGFDGSELRVSVPNEATGAWLREEYADKINAVLPAGVTICYVVKPCETPATEDAAPNLPDAADSKRVMVEWLESRLHEGIGMVLSDQDAETLWLIRQRAPREIFERAITAKVHKIKFWNLAVMIAREAADRYTQRRL